jgi:kynureninase
MSDEVALVLLPSVFYRSGQLLDMARLTAAAHAHDIPIGFDCAHSAGVIPHRFDDWDVDFAFWCNYKYLNTGPGSVGSLYVNRKHFDKLPGLSGWWGYQKERQFDMLHSWESAAGAGAWQISTIPVLSAAPLIGSLRIIGEAGIEKLRATSLAQTDYLMEMIERSGLTSQDYGYQIGTPREPERRGGHVAIEHEHGPQIARALKARNVIPDFRPPNIVRLAPIPLYTSYHELWRVVRHLREIISSGDYRKLDAGREMVA